MYLTLHNYNINDVNLPPELPPPICHLITLHGGVTIVIVGRLRVTDVWYKCNVLHYFCTVHFKGNSWETRKNQLFFI
jgi:hypothetical protein